MTKSWKSFLLCIFHSDTSKAEEEKEGKSQRQENLEPSQLIYSNIQKQFQVFLFGEDLI